MAMKQKIFESNNKGLFDIAVGEGNISADFATELQNARVAINGEVSKRRGRKFYNAVAAKHSAGNSIDTYAVGNQDAGISMYNDNNEQVGFALAYTGEAIQSVQFYLKKTGSPAGDIKAKIFASTGSVGSTAKPTGSMLAESVSLSPSVLTGSYVMTELTFEGPYTTSSADYCVLIEYSGGDASNYIEVGTDSSTPSHGSNTFATDAKDSGWAEDATQDLIFDIYKAGPTIESLMVYEGDYPADFEVLAQADTRLLRYTPATGAFDTVIKSGLTAGERLNWTMFRTKLCMSNGTDNPFKYGYLPRAAAPSDGTTTLGAKAGRTYYSAITYVTANGETIPSEETTTVIPASDVLDITAPITLTGATGWNVYHHTTSGALKLQNATPIAMGVNYGETTGALNDGAAPPSAHTGWYASDLADSPPKGKYIIALNSRLWVSGISGRDTQFVGSAVDDEDDWSTGSDYVDIDLAGVLARGDKIMGLGRLGQTGKLILGLKNHIVTYTVPPVFTDISIDKIVYNTGVMGHRAMDEVGLDNYLVEPEGLNSLKNELIIQGLRAKKLSDKIRDRLNPLLHAVADPDEVNVINNKKENEFWINIPSIQRRYIYDFSIKAWMEDRDVKIHQSVRTPDGDILSAGDYGRVYLEYQDASNVDIYADGDNSTSVAWRWDTPWLWLDNISIKKLFKYFQFKGSGAAGLFNLDVYFDFDTTSYKTYYLQTRPSKWDEIAWDTAYWDFPDVNKVLIPMIGMGRSVKFSFSATHKTDISISFYGVKYVPAGFRAND